MPKVLKVFYWGLFISFLGTLPLGTLNISATQIAVQESTTMAVDFAFGCLLTEMIYVRLSLVGINWVRKQVKLMKAMEWITLLIILALATGSFIAASKGTGEQKNVVLSNTMPRFLLGMLMSALNPIQIPFWFGWSTVLFQKNILEPRNDHYNIYIAGIGLGTLLGNFIFIFGGKYILQSIANSQAYFNWIIGGIFAITAIIQLLKLLYHKDGISQFEQKASL
jgi:threonine/homoserine/homoserine lactone efflux protein